MDDFVNLFSKIKQLSNDITEENYYDYGKQGYGILVRIHDMGTSKEDTYNLFFQYYDGLQDGLSKEWIGDMLDYISGWFVNMLFVMYLWLPMIFNLLITLILLRLKVEKANKELQK